MEELIKNIERAFFEDGKAILTEASLTYHGSPYAVGDITNFDIKIAIGAINEKSNKLRWYYNGYGVLIIVPVVN